MKIERNIKAGNLAIADDGQQWIVQRRRGDQWQAIKFVRSTKEILARCLRETGATPAETIALLAVLPDRHKTCPEAYGVRFDFQDVRKPKSRKINAAIHVIAGPIENYNARSLWAACLPLDPDNGAREREANNWDRIRKEIAWSKPRPPAPKEMQSGWRPCVPSVPVADDLSIPDFFKREPAADYGHEYLNSTGDHKWKITNH
jgi:hypothetical protein